MFEALSSNSSTAKKKMKMGDYLTDLCGLAEPQDGLVRIPLQLPSQNLRRSLQNPAASEMPLCMFCC
jgi:hypothetical protein